MTRRVGVPARLADASGARMKEGPLPRSRQGKGNGPAIGAKLGIGLTVGRPFYTAAIPVRIRAPHPELVGPKRSSASTPDQTPTDLAP